MHSFIALAKKSNFQTTTTGTSLIDDKQRSQRDSRLFPKFTDALTKKITEALTLLGFKQVASETPVDEQVSNSDEQASNFMSLNYLGAYVVNSLNKRKIKEAQKPFDELDYDVINDVQLSLPKPTYSERVYRRRKQIVWPVESGIHQAHSNGITGEGILVGVLDTGCDADHIQFRRKKIDFRYVPPYPVRDNLRAVRGFDVGAHGTHVCGIIAGEHVGVAPDADLMVASVIESDTYETSLERDKNNRSLYKHMSGTSMATPYVSGIAALYASANAKLYGEALRQHLLNTALPLQATEDRVGAGLARFTKNGNENP